jgi:hypothetical protein
MNPYTGIGVGKVTIIDLYTGIIVPEFNVGYRYLDDGYESISLAEPAFVKLFYILERYVQATPISTIQESHYNILPTSVFCWRGGPITVIGSKENVLDFKALF